MRVWDSGDDDLLNRILLVCSKRKLRLYLQKLAGGKDDEDDK